NKVDKALIADPHHPLIDNALSTTFPPGSTFKIVTGSTALSTGKVADANTPVSAPTKLTLPDTTNQLINDSGAACNNVFGALGEQVGGAALRDQANKFGMNDPNLTIPLPVAQSNYPPVSAPSLTAYSAIGQYSDTVTPLQEAMFSAAVANNGTLMKPYLVQKITAPDLTPIFAATPNTFSTALTPAAASSVKQMMISVVQ